jgi:hypothetical protein
VYHNEQRPEKEMPRLASPSAVFFVLASRGPGIVHSDKHDIGSYFDDIPPRNHDFRASPEHAEKPSGCRHDNGINFSLPEIQLQIADLTEFFAVHDINDVLRLEIGYLHGIPPLPLPPLSTI